MKKKNIDLNEGSINFWIPKGIFEFDDNSSHVLVNYANAQGSIFIVKDNDNKMKFFYVLLQKGRTDVEVDVRDLEKDKKHMVTATWSLNTKEINLYIDGNLKHAKSIIHY